MWKMSACLYEWVSVSVCVCAGVTLIYEHRPGIRQILSFSAVALCGGKCAFRRSQKMKIIFNGHSHEVSFSYHFFGYWYVSPSRVEHLNCIYAHASINQTIYQNMSFGDGWLWAGECSMLDYFFYYRATEPEGIDLWAQIAGIVLELSIMMMTTIVHGRTSWSQLLAVKCKQIHKNTKKKYSICLWSFYYH